jgi:hypothetical protein
MRRSKLTGAGMLAESGNPPHLMPKGASDAADRVGMMCERELSDPDLLRMAQVIYVEMTRQMGMNSRAMIDADHNLREVILDGSLDLVRVAAALSKRCCVHPSNVETITESARNPSDLSAVGLGGA